MIPRLSVAFLVIALLVLAGLQYQWIGQITVAERQRLEASLRQSSERFAEDFSEEIRYVATTFELRDGMPNDAVPLIVRYHEWTQVAPYPHLLRSLYLVRLTGQSGPELLHVNFDSENLEPAPSMPQLADLTESLTRDSQPGQFGAPFRRTPRVNGMVAVLIPLGRP